VCSAHKENLIGVRDEREREREREKLALKFTKAMCNSAEHKLIDNALALTAYDLIITTSRGSACIGDGTNNGR
jgi:hypothetical protein